MAGTYLNQKYQKALYKISDLELAYDSLSQIFEALSKDAREYRDQAEALAVYVKKLDALCEKILENCIGLPDSPQDVFMEELAEIRGGEPEDVGLVYRDVIDQAKVDVLDELLDRTLIFYGSPSVREDIKELRREYL